MALRMHIDINCAVDSHEAARIAIESGAAWITLTPPALPGDSPHVALAEWLDAMNDALTHARRRGVRAAVSLPLRARPGDIARHQLFVRALSRTHVDAIVLADMGLLRFAREHAPRLQLHLAPQASIANAASLGFFARRFGVTRACLANTLDIATAARIARSGHAEVEVFGYGAAGAMLEGLCSLSAFFCGASATRDGACSPDAVVTVDQSRRFRSTRLNGVLIDSAPVGVSASHPAPCTGRYRLGSRSSHVFGGHAGSRIMEALPELMLAGVRFVRIAPSGASPRAAAAIVAAWREAIASCRHDPQRFELQPRWRQALAASQTELPCTVSVTAHR